MSQAARKSCAVGMACHLTFSVHSKQSSLQFYLLGLLLVFVQHSTALGPEQFQHWLHLPCPRQLLTSPLVHPAGSMLAIGAQAELGGSSRVKVHKQQDLLHGAGAQTPPGCVISDLWMWSERAGAEHLHFVHFRAFLVLNLVWSCGLNVHLGLQCLRCTPEGHCEFHLKEPRRML